MRIAQRLYAQAYAKQQHKSLEECGLGTLEIVIIIAILIAIALLFRSQIVSFANSLMQKVFDHSIIDGIR